MQSRAAEGQRKPWERHNGIPWIVYATLIGTTFFWGANFIIGKYAVAGLPPLTVAAGRAAIGALTTMLWLRLNPREQTPLHRQDLPLMVALGVVGVFAFNILYFLGLQNAGAGEGSLVMATNPLITVILAGMILGETVTSRHLVGVAMSLVGVALIVTAGATGASAVGNQALGVGIFLLDAVCWALYSVLMRVAFRHYSPLAAAAYALSIGAILAIPTAGLELAAEGGLQILWRAPVISWLAVIYAGLMATTFGFICWNRGLAAMGATRASLFMNIVPVWAVALAGIVLGEKITLNHAAGGILVIASVMLANSGHRQQRRVRADALLQGEDRS